MWHSNSNTGHRRMHLIHPHSIGTALSNITIQTVGLTEPSFPILISELSLHDPPSISSGHEDWFYVEVAVDNVARTTSAVSKRELPWKETFTFNARRSSRVTLQVFAKRIHCRDTYVGSLQGTLDAFLGSSGEAVLSSPSSNDGHQAAWKTRLSFSVKRVGELTTEHRAEQHEPATEKMEAELYHPSSTALQERPLARDLTTSFAAIIALFPNANEVQQILDNANIFSPLLDKINLFLTFTDALGDIHPYVKMAAVILTGIAKVSTAQTVFQDHVKKLIETVADAHSFLSESHALVRINSHKEIICALSKHTVECLYFLQDIMKRGLGFFRSQQLLMSNAERKFQGYTQEFQRLRAALQERAAISTAVTVSRMYDEVLGIAAQGPLDNMHYVGDVHYTDVDDCDSLEPDWRLLSDEIIRWISGDSTERIFYLCGPVNCGKTTIAYEVARLFDELQRLGSSYFVRETQSPPNHQWQKGPRDPSCIFRNISRDIADHNPHFRQAVGEKVKTCATRNSSKIDKQFQDLILEPAKRINWCGPVVIVIDALDVCVEGRKRNDLLNVLATRTAELPPNFRILVTSCPDADIVHALEHKLHIMTKILEDATVPDNDSGISFSPIATCGRCSPSSVGDSVLESD
ncbi:hypothetical protein EDC04DRAFT_498560 [Pisolithus marmoratus]|nr:hypothetical protein EDC04DRAFT_498560 [Pisolithus marmoratus]